MCSQLSGLGIFPQWIVPVRRTPRESEIMRRKGSTWGRSIALLLAAAFQIASPAFAQAQTAGQTPTAAAQAAPPLLRSARR